MPTCKCEHCDGGIDFDEADFVMESNNGMREFGQTVTCPHCSQDTRVYRVMFKPGPPKEPKSPSRIPVAPRRRKPNIWPVGEVACAVVAIAMVADGCTMNTETSIHQIYAAVQYCAGLLLFGLALIISYLRIIYNRLGD